MSVKAIFCKVVLCVLLIGCSSSKISVVSNLIRVDHPVNAIAVAPGRGFMAEAIAIELLNKGFRVIDPAQTSNLMIRLNLTEVDVSLPTGLAALKDAGIDAYLTVMTISNYQGRIESATARVTSTHNGQIIAGVSWQNGWGCAPDSPCDALMSSGTTEAAQEIVVGLAKTLKANQ
ncbi:MAG: hypothetical protein ACKVIX_03745 [Sphingomonadales bacterium]